MLCSLDKVSNNWSSCLRLTVGLSALLLAPSTGIVAGSFSAPMSLVTAIGLGTRDLRLWDQQPQRSYCLCHVAHPCGTSDALMMRPCGVAELQQDVMEVDDQLMPACAQQSAEANQQSSACAQQSAEAKCRSQSAPLSI